VLQSSVYSHFARLARENAVLRLARQDVKEQHPDSNQPPLLAHFCLG
jgi:hypothetical protein